MKAEIEQRDKALEILKNKELEGIVKLVRAEQEIKSLITEVIKQPTEVKINKDHGLHHDLPSNDILEFTVPQIAFQECGDIFHGVFVLDHRLLSRGRYYGGYWIGGACAKHDGLNALEQVIGFPGFAYHWTI
ncbi:hypothetical protein Ddye_030333 [Dipteronia dyeriana]|uniref:Uncharacterized protein n=1 Tax=Dipteronia dyeriana TaxID=168575 RepID=A0AAD9TGW5_9ROSI|nr:hypothetical protein Ddye_030333 [Dipteronia dyeriana]